MEVNSYYQALVIILSITLAFFLILGIIALVKFIQILDHMKRITAKAEQVVDKANSVTEFLQKSTGTFAFGKLVSNIAQHFSKHKNERGKDEER